MQCKHRKYSIFTVLIVSQKEEIMKEISVLDSEKDVIAHVFVKGDVVKGIIRDGVTVIVDGEELRNNESE